MRSFSSLLVFSAHFHVTTIRSFSSLFDGVSAKIFRWFCDVHCWALIFGVNYNLGPKLLSMFY
jgi:hypothetical protein